MEFWLQTATLDIHERRSDNLDNLSDIWFNELAFHYKNKNDLWSRIAFCYDNNIYFTIRAYRDTDIAENTDEFNFAFDEMYDIPASPVDLLIWMINIPNNNQAVLYKLRWS
jgi:hypothetical protein